MEESCIQHPNFTLVDAHLIATTIPGPGKRYKIYMCFLHSCPGMPGQGIVTKFNVYFVTFWILHLSTMLPIIHWFSLLYLDLALGWMKKHKVVKQILQHLYPIDIDNYQTKFQVNRSRFRGCSSTDLLSGQNTKEIAVQSDITFFWSIWFLDRWFTFWPFFQKTHHLTIFMAINYEAILILMANYRKWSLWQCSIWP